MLNLNSVIPKKALPCAKPRHMSHRALKSIQSFFPEKDGKKKRKGKEGTKSHASVIFHLFVGKPAVNGFLLNFAH